MNRHDADLISYYSAEFATGRRSALSEFRHGLRREFLGLIEDEALGGPVLDAGAGPGLDTHEFAAAGLDVIGLDLTSAHAAAIAGRGIPALAASVVDLPLATGSVGAAWTMSTLMHLPITLAERAVAELVRVVVPGGPIAIGTWGGDDTEEFVDGPDGLPKRYFRRSSEATWVGILERHAEVVSFSVHEVDAADEGYHFAVVRRSSNAAGLV